MGDGELWGLGPELSERCGFSLCHVSRASDAVLVDDYIDFSRVEDDYIILLNAHSIQLHLGLIITFTLVRKAERLSVGEMIGGGFGTKF